MSTQSRLKECSLEVSNTVQLYKIDKRLAEPMDVEPMTKSRQMFLQSLM